jgi:hypothetical protein
VLKNNNLSEESKQKGYSLLEIPISLFIIGLVLVIYHAASNTVILNVNAKHQELAQRIAVSKMEDLRAGSYTTLPASGSFTHSYLSQLPNSSAQIVITNYNVDTKKVVVTVTWKEPGNVNTRTVSFTTLMTKNGL